MNHLQFTESLNWPKAFRSRLEAWEAFLVPYYFAFIGLRMIFLKILAFEENFPSKLLRLSLTFVLEIYFQFRYCAKLRWIFVFVCYWNSFFFFCCLYVNGVVVSYYMNTFNFSILVDADETQRWVPPVNSIINIVTQCCLAIWEKAWNC